MAQQPTTFQQNASALPSYRSIAIAPAKILPRPGTPDDDNKRKWGASMGNSNLDLDIMNKKRTFLPDYKTIVCSLLTEKNRKKE